MSEGKAPRSPDMTHDVPIRPERPSDAQGIAQVTRDAFAAHAHSSHTEHLMIDALRRDGALAISLVAEHDAQVIGHVAFSPVSIGDGAPGWFGLGPLSVAPHAQGQGIGQALVRAGLAALAQRGAHGCVVLGEPDYYGRFGFRNEPDLWLADVPQSYFLARPFGDRRAAGEVTYAAAFDAFEASNDAA